jgi:hypothetical protein
MGSTLIFAQGSKFEPDPRSARRAQVAEPLTPQTRRWIAVLPTDVQPHNLSERYPRIANRICRLWSSQAECLDYLESLLMDRRGDRQGFELDIAMELAGVKDHFETQVSHVPQTTWDQIIERQLV